MTIMSGELSSILFCIDAKLSQKMKSLLGKV